MRYGVVILPEHEWTRAQGVWGRAEELGFDHAWTYDHVRWRWLREQPWFAALPTLTAAAVVTARIRLGTLVACPGLHHPITFAKEMMTLDDVSAGRAVCGVGAGGYDSDVLQRDAVGGRERVRRFEEFVELTDRLLRQRPGGFEGAHYRSAEVVLQPACRQVPRIPLAIAAAGPRGMALAARFAETWVTSGTPGCFDAVPYERTVEEIARQSAALDEACVAAGRDPATLGRLLLTGAMVGGVLDSVGAFEDAAGRFAEVGITDFVVHWPRESFPYRGRVDVLEDVAATVLWRRDARAVAGGAPAAAARTGAE